MARFVDREHALHALERQYNREEASLFVLYGRRRVGKTTLLMEFCKGKPHVYFTASQEDIRRNRADFQDVAWKTCGNAALAPDSALSWAGILGTIVPEGQEQRVVVVLDEFQYLGISDPAFPSVLQKIWDLTLCHRNVLLILCGSLISMMMSQTLSYDSPLYGRRTGQLRLAPLSFSSFTEFFPVEKRSDLPRMVDIYAVTGGVPKYIQTFMEKGCTSLYDSISELVLDSSSFLYSEPEFFLNKEVREVGTYFSILRAIAAGNHKMSRLSRALEKKSSSLTSPLSTLISCDLVEREVPVTESKPAASKMGQYRIRDNYFAFWFRFVYPNRMELDAGRSDFVLQKIQEEFRSKHAAFVFEDVCREFFENWIKGAHLPCSFNRVGRWWAGGDTEIDIVAVDDLSSGHILFGECKYRENRPVGQDVLYELMGKSKSVRWGSPEREEYWALFSVSGFTPDLVARTEDMPGLLLFDMSSWPGKRVLP